MILLSYLISDATPVYGNGETPEIKTQRSMAEGDTCNTLSLSMSNHTGTHVDCPFHFDPDGKTLSDYPPDFWLLTCVEVIDIKPVPESGSLINADCLRRCISEQYDHTAEIVLIRTGWHRFRDERRFWRNSPGLDPDTAEFLRNRYPDLRFLGTDLISISSYAKSDIGKQAHRVFLKQAPPILLIEDMNLADIPSNGIDNLLITPLNIKGADGSPCNVYANIDCGT